MRVRSLASVGLVLSLLAACGGGGGPGGIGVPGFLVAAGGPGSFDVGMAVATWPDGSFVVTGEMDDPSATFGAGEAGETVLPAAGTTECFVARHHADGTLDWARNSQGTTGRTIGLDVDVFADGSCVVTGWFVDQATFGAGTPQSTTLTDLTGDGDIFLARYAADGTLTWATSAGRDFFDAGIEVEALDDGSCLVCGLFTTIANFGVGEPNQTTLMAMDRAAFFARYAADGSLVWVTSADGSGDDTAEDIALLPDGTFLATGHFATTATFGAGEPNQTALVSTGTLDVFLARYAADGTLLWARRAGGADIDQGYAIDAFPDGSFVVVGTYRGVAVFGPGEAQETSLASLDPMHTDVFVARYAADGTLQWAQDAGSAAADSARDVAAHPDGSFVVAGAYDTIAAWGDPLDPPQTFHVALGGRDGFLARYGPDGAVRWVRSGGGSTGDDRLLGVAFHADGGIAFCGQFDAALVFNPFDPPAAAVVAVGGGEDILVGRADASGGF